MTLLPEKIVSPGKKTPRRWLKNDGFGLLPFRKVILYKGTFKQQHTCFFANLKMHFHVFQMSTVGDFRFLDVGVNFHGR